MIYHGVCKGHGVLKGLCPFTCLEDLFSRMILDEDIHFPQYGTEEILVNGFHPLEPALVRSSQRRSARGEDEPRESARQRTPVRPSLDGAIGYHGTQDIVLLGQEHPIHGRKSSVCAVEYRGTQSQHRSHVVTPRTPSR